MASVSQRIPNFLGGFSQQPDSLKLPGQLTQADNCIPDPTYGLLKRPGLKLVSALPNATADGQWFSIIRDSNEQYIGQFSPTGQLRIWNALNGIQATVNPQTAAATAYVSGVATSDFEVLQINDYNFVLNRTKTVTKLTTTSPTRDPEALIILRVAGYDTKYTVTLDGTVYSYSTPATGTISVELIINHLASQIPNSFTVTKTSNVIHITKSTDFTIEAKGGLSSTSLEAFKGSVRDVADLPGSCVQDMVLKIQNSNRVNGDEYYVKFTVDGTASSGVGAWEETVESGILTTIDPDTMPHAIIRESNGTFTFRSLNEADKDGEDLYWVERRVGDDNTNPFPTFVDQKITGMSFFRNRLVLLAGTNVICSQPGNFFNMFRVSALTTSDADVVDLASGSLRPVSMRYAIGDQLGLLIFSENAQFMLSSEGDAFGPTNAQIKAFSTLANNPKIAPVETGTSIVYVDENQDFSQVTEMVVTSVDNRPSMADLSRTSPNYVPGDLRSMVANSSASMVTFLGNDDPDELYIFKFFNSGNDRVMAAWIKWNLPGDCLLQATSHDQYFFVTTQANGVCLSTCTVLSDVEGTAVNNNGIAYEYRLDLFTSSLTVAYDSANDKTRVLFPTNTYDSTLTPVVVVDDSSTSKGTIYRNPTHGNDGTNDYVEIPGNRTTASRITLGYQYTTTIGLPKFFRKSAQATGTVQADVVNIPRVTRLVIQSSDSGPFDASVSLKGRTTKTYSFPQTIANSYKANSAPLPEIIDNTIPIYGKGTDADVTITSNTPFPVSFVAATWYGTYTTKGITQI
jgi:hypothetical protein|tara:strand:+ start:382 stop:2775 length:2394 start_codon:yes stop_codon:yes gene_type:complete